MYITMHKTKMGSPDGFGVKVYHIGHIYYVPDSLASEFIRHGYAKATIDKEAV